MSTLERQRGAQLSFIDILFPPEKPKLYQVSAKNLARYAGLRDIRPEEWDEYFPNTGKPWEPDELEYLAKYWGHDDILSLSYALGRPPWGLQRVVCRMRKQGTSIQYLRDDKPNDVVDIASRKRKKKQRPPVQTSQTAVAR